MTESQETEAPVAPPRPEGIPPRRPEFVAEDAQSKAAWILFFVAGMGLLGYLAGGWLVATIVAILVMVTIHELGHYLTAKWSKMKVTEFFIGFGPRLWSFRRGETDYGVKPIMVGAYVRIVGMNNLDEVPPEDEARTYRQSSFPKRLATVLAGPATHFVMAGVLMFVLLGFLGVPAGLFGTDDDWVVDGVTANSAAANAKVQDGDKIVAFDGEPLASFEELTEHIRDSEVGQEVTLTILRGGREIERTTEIVGRPRAAATEEAKAGTPFLGVGEGRPDATMGTFEALVQTPGQTLSFTYDNLVALKDVVTPSSLSRFAEEVGEGADEEREGVGSGSGSGSGEVEEDGRLVSIVGAVRIGALLGEQGFDRWLLFLIQINIFVGLINLVPLLPFDGGHAVVAIYERIRSRNGQRYHADVAKLLPVAYAVVMGLIVLGVTTMYLDLVDPIN